MAENKESGVQKGLEKMRNNGVTLYNHCPPRSYLSGPCISIVPGMISAIYMAGGMAVSCFTFGDFSSDSELRRRTIAEFVGEFGILQSDKPIDIVSTDGGKSGVERMKNDLIQAGIQVRQVDTPYVWTL